MKTYTKPLLSIILFVVCSSVLFAQQLDWAFAIRSGDFSTIEDIVLDDEGNTYFIGESNDTLQYEIGGVSYKINSVVHDAYFGKVSPAGNLLWLHNLGSRGFEYGNSIALDPSGYVYITGMFGDSMDCDFGPGTAYIVPQDVFAGYLIKYDTAGQYQWNYVFDGPGTDKGENVEVDSNGDIILNGTIAGLTDFDPGVAIASLDGSNGGNFILKLDSAGNYKWVGQIASRIQELKVDNFKNIYLCGKFSDSLDIDLGSGTRIIYSGSNEEAFLIKLDSNGLLVWGRTIEGIETLSPEAISVDKKGFVYWGGRFFDDAIFDPDSAVVYLSSPSSNIPNGFVLKYDSTGFLQWVKTYPGSRGTGVSEITLDQFDNPYITGFINGDVDLDLGDSTELRPNINRPDGRGVFLSKWDEDGNELKWNIYLENDTSNRFEFVKIDISKDNKISTIGKVWRGSIDLDPDSIATSFFEVGDFVFQQFSQCFIDSIIADSGCITYSYRGETFNQSGQYDRLYTDFRSNCDARIHLDVSIFPEYNGIFDTVSVCPKGSFTPPNGVPIDSIVTPFATQATLISSAGCDSVVDYWIELAPDHSDFESFDVCYGSSYTFPDGTQLTNITNDTSYLSQLLTSSNSCDSNITTLLNVVSVDNDLLVNRDTLITAATGASYSYQWLDCGNAYDPIQGANSRVFAAPGNGSYAVEVSREGCKDTSVCYSVFVLANEGLASHNLRLYPNPAEDVCWIEAEGAMPVMHARLFDLRGRLLMEKKAFQSSKLSLDLSGLDAGMYVVELSDGTSRQSLRLMHH